jgi:hypothetical protein
VTISVDELADALLAATTRQGRTQRLDLSKIDGMFLCCFAADFSWNLLAKLNQGAKEAGIEVVLPNSMVASCARNRKSFGAVFWEALGEYRVRVSEVAKPALDLGTVLDFVDRNLYSFGRQPTFDAQNRVIGWKVVDPDRLQDPTVMVPLQDTDMEELRQILQLTPDRSMPSLVEIG